MENLKGFTRPLIYDVNYGKQELLILKHRSKVLNYLAIGTFRLFMILFISSGILIIDLVTKIINFTDEIFYRQKNIVFGSNVKLCN